jgi:carbamoyltransferase
LGAAYYIYHQVLGRPRTFVMNNAYTGPAFDDGVIERALQRHGVAYEALDAETIAHRAAALAADGKVVGWFQGRMEWGPRALGNRSIVADPRRPDMKDVLNARIKHREPFRPFGASVLAEDVAEWFAIPTDRPGAASCRDLMILAYPARGDLAGLIPAVVHQDGTCRLQVVDHERAPLFHTLITRFRELSGVPLVLNTSFNDQEPLVASPEDALKTFATAEIDALFLGDRLVRRAR